MRAVKEALHVSTAPSTVVCRENEQRRVLEFCKACVEQEKAGSLYICGCPGTGKSLSMEKAKHLLVDWAKEVKLLLPLYLIVMTLYWINCSNKQVGHQQPDVLSINCTSLAKTDIFSKVLISTTYLVAIKTSTMLSCCLYWQILGGAQPRKKVNGSTTSALQQLQNLYSQKPRSSAMKMMWDNTFVQDLHFWVISVPVSGLDDTK